MPPTTTHRSGLLRIGLALWDAMSWVMAVIALVVARYSFSLSGPESTFVLQYSAAAVVLQVLVGVVTKLYRGRHSVASFEEAALLAVVALGIGLVLGFMSVLFATPGYPRVVTFTVPLAALVLMAAGRFVFRTLTRQPAPRRGARNRSSSTARATPGSSSAACWRYDPDAPYRDRRLHRRRPRQGEPAPVTGARVLGGREPSSSRPPAEHGVRTVIVAIPTGDRALMQRDLPHHRRRRPEDPRHAARPARSSADACSSSSLHQLDVTDLLGRAQIKTNLGGDLRLSGRARSCWSPARAARSASELARQVHRFGPTELVMLDRDESGLHGTQLSIFNQGLLDTPNMVLCDIRDAEALDQVFADHRPEVVFHAAALKHLPMLEQYPLEGWKTNTLGTLNVLRRGREVRRRAAS